jgi:hypothetical protein
MKRYSSSTNETTSLWNGQQWICVGRCGSMLSKRFFIWTSSGLASFGGIRSSLIIVTSVTEGFRNWDSRYSASVLSSSGVENYVAVWLDCATMGQSCIQAFPWSGASAYPNNRLLCPGWWCWLKPCRHYRHPFRVKGRLLRVETGSSEFWFWKQEDCEETLNWPDCNECLSSSLCMKMNMFG